MSSQTYNVAASRSHLYVVMQAVMSYLVMNLRCVLYLGRELSSSVWKKAREHPGYGSRKGEVAVITGGNRGIGEVLVKKLLQCDMHVIMGVRDVSAGQQAVDRIRESGVTTGTYSIVHLDMACLESVRNFGKSVQDMDMPISLLINNAGIMIVPYEKTKDGLESQFQVNYLSHFLLTHLLLPQLRKGGTPQRCSRVINVTSGAHYASKVHLEDLQLKGLHSPELAYGHSKLLQTMFSKYLNQRVEEEGSLVRSFAVHPGVVFTDLYTTIWWVSTFPKVAKAFFMTVEQGADTVFFAAMSPTLESKGGRYLENWVERIPNKDVSNQAKIENLFQQSCEMVSVGNYFGKNGVVKNGHKNGNGVHIS